MEKGNTPDNLGEMRSNEEITLLINTCHYFDDLEKIKKDLGDRLETDPIIKKTYNERQYHLAYEKFEEADKILSNEIMIVDPKNVLNVIEKLKLVFTHAPDYTLIKTLMSAGSKEPEDLRIKALEKLADLESEYVTKRDKLENLVRTKPASTYDEKTVKDKLSEIEKILSRLQEKID